MEQFRLLTDSTADLSQEMVDEFGLVVYPMEFILDGTS